MQEKYDFEFCVICNVEPQFPELKNFRYVKWQLEREIQDLQRLDMGLMPVPDGTWEKGKVGFKAIQYSALGIVPVASSVGAGPDVVKDGQTGIVVGNTDAEWYAALEWLLQNRHKWSEIGKAARNHILTHYSVPSQASAYIGLFR